VKDKMLFAIRPMEPRDADAVRNLMRQLCGYAMTREEMRGRLEFVASPFDWLFVQWKTLWLAR
jgi:hypothetical protein